jgi:uncharacterized protein with PhoU and TrkA domain
MLGEEIRYKPISVRDLLTELHTTSTLMIDLAYSAVLFNDNELAEEVIELEEKVLDLKTFLLMNTAIAIKDAEDAEAMVGIMRMGSVADMISHASGSIARIVLLGLGVDPYILEAFTKIQERLVRTKILPESILAGKTLGKLKLETNIGVNVMTVRRGKELIMNPGSKTMLKEGDVLIARGSDVGVLEFDKLAKGEMKVVPRPKLGLGEGST